MSPHVGLIPITWMVESQSRVLLHCPHFLERLPGAYKFRWGFPENEIWQLGHVRFWDCHVAGSQATTFPLWVSATVKLEIVRDNPPRISAICYPVSASGCGWPLFRIPKDTQGRLEGFPSSRRGTWNIIWFDFR
jgi:hypothetical protein